jgi:hypothetical protein
MDYNKYLTASPTEQIKMMVAAITEQQERLDPKNFLSASPIDKLAMMAKSIEDEAEKIRSGYYQTAPYHEQIGFIARQLQEQIRKETQLKIDEIEFHLSWLEKAKAISFRCWMQLTNLCPTSKTWKKLINFSTN